VTLQSRKEVGSLFTHSVTARDRISDEQVNNSGSTLEPTLIENVGQKSYSLGRRTKAASAKMIDEYTDKLPMIPATSVQEIENWLQPFVEAGVDRLIVPYVPGDGTCHRRCSQVR